MHIEGNVSSRYLIEHAYVDESGFHRIIDDNKITVNGEKIEIIEEATDKKAPLTQWDEDEGVPMGDIVKIHLLLNGESITTPSEIWLSNRNRGSRYFSWLDIITVKDYATEKSFIKIIQRLTGDNELENRQWKIITIDEEGDVIEERINYPSQNIKPLNVELIHFSNTALISFGYYSDITKGYPNLIFSLIYPFVSGIIGLIGVIITSVKIRQKIGS